MSQSLNQIQRNSFYNQRINHCFIPVVAAVECPLGDLSLFVEADFEAVVEVVPVSVAVFGASVLGVVAAVVGDPLGEDLKDISSDVSATNFRLVVLMPEGVVDTWEPGLPPTASSSCNKIPTVRKSKKKKE